MFAGNVGIGDTNPAERLSIKGAGTQVISLHNTTAGSDASPSSSSINFYGHIGNGGPEPRVRIEAQDKRGTRNGGWLNIATADDTNTLVDALHIDKAQNVSIGGTLPSSPNISLNANGSAEFAGTVTSTNSFLANKQSNFVYPGGTGMSRNDLINNSSLRLVNGDNTASGTASIINVQGVGTTANSAYSFLSFVTPGNTGGNYISLATAVQVVLADEGSVATAR